MVVLPLLRGLLGITSSTTAATLTVAPHLPADWNRWSASHVPACGGSAELVYTRTEKQVELGVEWHPRHSPEAGPGPEIGKSCTLVFSPAISLHARTGKNVQVQKTLTDQHATISRQLMPGANFIRIPVAHDFGIAVPAPLPPLGEASQNLKIVKEEWSASGKSLRLEVQGLAGMTYRFKTYGAHVASVEGGRIFDSGAGVQGVEVSFPLNVSSPGFSEQVVVLQFPD